MLKKKKLLFVLAGLSTLFLMSLIASIYVFGINSTGYYLITTEGLKVEFTQAFTGAVIDTTDSEITFEDEALIFNSGDWLWMNVSVDIIKTDLSNGTCEWENDCDVEIIGEWNEIGSYVDITDGSTIMWKENESHIRTYITCQRHSCEQNISVNVEFIPDFDRETPIH